MAGICSCYFGKIAVCERGDDSKVKLVGYKRQSRAWAGPDIHSVWLLSSFSSSFLVCPILKSDSVRGELVDKCGDTFVEKGDDTFVDEW